MSHSPQKTRLPQQWLNCGEWCPPPQPKPEAKRRMQDESPTPAAEQKQAEQVERWPSIESERNPVAPSGFMSWMRPSARGIPSTPGTAWLYERGAPTARTFNRLRLSQLANPIKGSARLRAGKEVAGSLVYCRVRAALLLVGSGDQPVVAVEPSSTKERPRLEQSGHGQAKEPD